MIGGQIKAFEVRKSEEVATGIERIVKPTVTKIGADDMTNVVIALYTSPLVAITTFRLS